MKSVIFAVMATMAVAGCTTAERDAVTGAAVGAGGAALLGANAGGVVAAGVIGAAAGVLIGNATRDGWCVYRDRNGQTYEARCRRR